MVLNMLTFLIICLLIQIVIINLLIYHWLKNKIFIEKRDFLYRNSEKLLLILESIKTQAYSKVFKEYVMVKTMDRIKINHNDLENAARNYVKVVVEYCGENLINDIVEIYGDKKNFYEFLMDGFVDKIIVDESEMVGKRLTPDLFEERE